MNMKNYWVAMKKNFFSWIDTWYTVAPSTKPEEKVYSIIVMIREFFYGNVNVITIGKTIYLGI